MANWVPILPRPPAGDATAAAHSATPAPTGIDARRHRHRLAVRRAYYERLSTLAKLRDEQQALQQAYDRLLASSAPSLGSSSPTEPSELTNPPAVDTLESLLVKLLRLKDALVKENEALRVATKRHDEYQARLRIFQQEASENHRLPDDWDTLSPICSEPPSHPVVAVPPLTLQACYALIREAWPRIRSFMQSTSRLRSGSQVFGWTHRYRFSPDHVLEYAISKRFPHVDAYELSQRGWRIMTTGRHYQALHSATMSSRFHLVQRVNNDNLVFLRVMQREQQPTVFKTLLLASQFHVDDGYMTVFRNLTPLQTDEPNVTWLPMFSWTYFRDSGGSDAATAFHFGGEMRHTSSDNARFWMMELLLMALRWEAMAVGPLFTLTSD